MLGDAEDPAQHLGTAACRTGVNQAEWGVTPDILGSVERLFRFPEPLPPALAAELWVRKVRKEEPGQTCGSLAQFLSLLLGSQAGLDFHVHPSPL